MEVGRGDLTTQVEVRTNDELGELGRAFKSLQRSSKLEREAVMARAENAQREVQVWKSACSGKARQVEELRVRADG